MKSTTKLPSIHELLRADENTEASLRIKLEKTEKELAETKAELEQATKLLAEQRANIALF